MSTKPARSARALAVPFVGLCLLLGSGCGGAAQHFGLVGQAAEGPEVRGSVQVEPIQGGQRIVLVEVQHLPPPERLASGRSAYAVWLHEADAPPTLVGTLDYDRSQRSGNLFAVTGKSNFVVTVTAEQHASPALPSELLVAEHRIAGP